MKLTGASKPKSFKVRGKQGYKFKMPQTFGNGGMPMPPPSGTPMGPPMAPMGPPQGVPPPADPAVALKQKIDSLPPKDKAKVKKLMVSKLKAAMQAQKAGGGAPMAAPPGMKAGGKVESKAMVQKEIDFFKKKGAPKSMITHEIAEKNAMAKGGAVRGIGIARKGGGRGRIV